MNSASNNKANWLHVGVTSKRSIQDSGYNTYDANLNILNNTILAYNPTYLGDYGSEVNVSSNIGLLVHSNEHSLFNTGATGGTGDDNIVTIDGNTTLADTNHYFYKSCSEIYSSAKITNNTFKGIKNNGSPTIILNLYGYQSIVTNNMLCRKGDITNNFQLFTGIINIDYYIKYSGASDFTQYFNPNGIIRNNNFDLSYPGTDATDTKIVDVPANFIYTDNINQTGNLYLPLNDQVSLYNNGKAAYIISSYSNVDLSCYTVSLSDKYFKFVNNSASTFQEVRMDKSFNLTKFLPRRVRVNSIKINMYASSLPVGGQVLLSLRKSNTTTNVMDVFTQTHSPYNNGNLLSTSSSLLLNTVSITGNTSLELDLDSSVTNYNFSFQEDYELFLDLSISSFKQSAIGIDTELVMSPIQIKYTWL